MIIFLAPRLQYNLKLAEIAVYISGKYQAMDANSQSDFIHTDGILGETKTIDNFISRLDLVHYIN